MWRPFEAGATVGQRGSEEGVILRDEEHELGARITLEWGCSHGVPFAVTCGIYGWFFHTRRMETEGEADFSAMLDGLSAILERVCSASDPEAESERSLVGEAISDFVSRFP
jgi:hypothetical protein